ncbi:fibrocystin-L isoform X1 [Perognathus longimembris pacificus]|uniref:fibrocystin-L isoform X1 n=1 Tax=Perognathus longimembris pacificus TaxID=214514 RepID=UPI002019301E|nr:fibrocystin-L isoform X1 [Perognathus longimembris pacificus]
MGHLWLLETWGLWGLLLWAADLRTDGSKTIPRVTEVIPKYGSINGATRLTIKGEGFSQANQFNYGVDNAELGNSVQLVSSFQSITCDVEKDSSHSTQITCYTRAMPEDSYTVRVSVDGVPIAENHTCHGRSGSWACSFHTKSFRTPTIRNITPLSGTPGALITIQGRIFTDVYGSNIAVSSNGKNVRILRVYIGGMPCELLITQSDDLYGLKLDHPSGDMGSMICKMTGTYIGHHNVSFILDSDYGRSFPQKMTYFVSSLNKIFMFQTYAEITSISPSKGSLRGGTVLTVSGQFFDQTDLPVKVLVGGQACDILSVTEDRIYCKTRPQPPVLKTLYPGGRGLKLEVWNNSRPVHLEEILEYNEDTLGYMGATWVDSASYVWPLEQDTFVARFSGFLVAPDSDVYRFYIKGDDRYAIYFSPTGLPEDKVRIAYHSANSNSYFSSPSQRSDDIHLHKGKEYYIEILLQEYRLSAFVDVGLYQYRTVYSEQQTGDAVNEEQVIKSQSAIIQEVQVIILENWETTNATNEVQRITVTSPCVEANLCSLYQYRLIYNKEKTVLLAADASDFILQSALNDLWSIKPDTVQVTRTQNLQSYIYTITFISNRGDFDLLGYELFDGNNVTLDITEQTKGKPSLETFTLNWDGVTSMPLNPRSSEVEFQVAVEEMVSTKCPPQITHLEEGFVVKYFRDYETDFDLEYTSRGQKTAETDAYCGRYSLKNPAALFDSADAKPNKLPYGDILLFPYNQFCLAYKGFLANYIGLKFKYQDNGKITRSTDSQFTYNFAYGNNWTYTCIDLLALIQTKHSGTSFSLQRISLQKASESQSFYVDVVYIGQTPTLSTFNEMPKRRLAALANKGIYLEHFQVNQTRINGSTVTVQYSVTMTSYNCSCNIPMMAVSFGQKITNEIETESVYRGINWPGESKIRIRRIQEASPPISGNFDIHAYGHTLKGIPAAVSAADLQFALQSLEEVGRVSVTREGTCAGYSWNIKWRSMCGKQNLLQINDSNITGVRANMTVSTIKEGGLFRQHILGDLLRVPSQEPQVEVYVNGIPAKCSGDCGFIWDSMATPIVLATRPSQGSYEESTILTIVGSGFSPSSAVSVSLGPTVCSILSVKDNEITCQIQSGSAGRVRVAVFIAEAGLAEHAEEKGLYFTYQSQITHIWPDSGSLAGGTLLTISGFGFSENSKVLVGNETCKVIEGDTNRITCRTPKRTEGTVDISVVTNGIQAMVKDVFSYSCLKTPVITDFSPKVRTILGDVNLTIKGYNFGNELAQNLVVHVGGKTCQVLSWNFTGIQCSLPLLPPGKHEVYVEVRTWGFASTRDKSNASIQYILEVTHMFPQRGSLYGGTEITVVGFGFSTIPTENVVLLGTFPCNVTSSSESMIRCTLHSTGNVFRITNNGDNLEHGFGYAWSPSVLNVSVGDTVVWRWQSHPFLKGIGYRVFSVSSPGSVIYDGKGFNNGRQKSLSGSFSYQFTSPGTHYYSSGFIEESHSISLQGVINVLPAETRHLPLQLFVGGMEATYAQGGSENLHLGSSVAGCLATEPLCDLNNTMVENSSRLLFELSSCISPSISNITPSSGTVNELLTIIGYGFSNLTCANKVTIGNYPCVVKESNNNSIICRIDPQNSMDVGVREIVTLIVYNLGTAIITLSSEFDRRFVLLPNIDMVLPNEGSTTGMTRVTIYGSGFTVSSAGVEVFMGHLSCKVLTVTYTAIECETPPAPEQHVHVDLLIHGVPARCQGTCSFSYLESLTPYITRIFPDSIEGSAKVLVEGKGLGTVLEDISVFIGNQQFRAVDVTEKNLTVLLTALPAGLHSLRVVVRSKGLALGNGTISSPAVASVSPSSGSIGGGTALLITGNGFYPGNTTVTIGEDPCQILFINSSEIYCSTPAGKAGVANLKICVNTVTYPPLTFTYTSEDTPLLTGIIPSRGPPGTEIEITGSNFGTDISEISVVITDVQCNVTMVNDTVLQCLVGAHEGGIFPVMMHHKKKGSAISTIVFESPLQIQNIHPRQGSFGGGQTMTVRGTGFNPQHSIILVCGSECVIDRLRSNSTTLLCEIPPNDGPGPEQACEVIVKNGQDSSPFSTLFTYTMSLTPLITEVSPRRGSTAGGTRLTVMGSGFSENIQSVQVTIAGARCDTEYSNKTHIICSTSAHTPSGWAPVLLHVRNMGMAKMENADFLYVDVWSSNHSWGGASPPEEGSLAVITKGQIILLDQSTPVLKMLLIQGGTLIFDEADIELQAENILITDGGILQIGTEASPFQHKAIITLHGHLRSPELPVYGAKTLAVREGTLDLHGLPVAVVWTRLAHTAKAGERTLIVQQAVTWKAGDDIVIASTGHRHSQRENEKRTIASVSADGVNITLTEPLNHTHLGMTITLPDGTLFEARAEVGILTRNIIIRGSHNLEWNNKIPACPEGFDTGEFATQTCLQGKFGEEIGSDQFGGCIMFHAPLPNADMVTGRIEYVEVFHAGQAFRLGRYPIHWHLLGDLQFKSYVRGCAIHQTYNRAVTIHNTHHLLVERNIIYDIKGGAFFIEDGIEHGNILQYNLAIFVQQSTSLLNDDVTPAAFWVTNPNNTICHNAAAGGTHFGFWYRMNNHPDGPSYDRNICQKRVPLGEFFNNTVHSQGWFGLWIFEEYFPMQTGSCTSTVPVPAIFRSLTTWNCQKGAEWVNGGALQFHNFVMVNNHEAGIETKRILSPYVGGWGETNGAMIKNAKIVGHLEELGMGPAFCTSRGLVLPFSEGLTVSSVQFMNFDRPVCVALGVTSITGVCNERCGGWSAKFVDIQYFHTPNKAGFRWEHEALLIDLDGSLTGHKGYTVIPHSPLLDPSHCTQEAAWSIGFPGSVCDTSVSFHRLAFNKPSPISLLEKDVVLSDSFGTSVVPFQKKRLTHMSGWMALIPNANHINWYFKGVDHITNISYTSTFYGFKEEDYVIISHNFTKNPDMFNVIDMRNGSSNPLNWNTSKNGDWHLEANTSTLYYLVSGRSDLQQNQPISGTLDPNVKDVIINFQAYCCILQDCFPAHPSSRKPVPRKRPSTYNLWSNDSFWQSSPENNYTVPHPGASVIIPEGTWIVADTDLPPMERLIVWGVLELEDKSKVGAAGPSYRRVVLNATYISVQGGRLIGGWDDNPFNGELLIVLRGNHTTPEWALPEGPNQGAKVLGVFGELDLHGLPRSIYKTKLLETAEAGSKVLSLTDAVDWQEGEEIVITTTSYDFHQTETRSIVKILHGHKILILNDSLSFTHLAEKYYVPETGQSYALAADVGILTRNIKIIGEEYPGWAKDSFGACILVGSFTGNMMTFKGNARISNVEFYHSGQEGFRDSTDPRYAITFLNLGPVQEHGVSYVRGCSFHHGFSPAIGVFGTDGLDIDDNIIHFTVGEGIRIWGDANRVRGNLVTLSVWPGTYQNRKDLSSNLWHAAIEINRGTNTVLQKNVVAGFGRAGYRIDGEHCSSQSNPMEDWFDNEAHGGLYGIYMNQDGLPGCSLIQGFTIWDCWDYGIYFQTTESVHIYNVTLVNNGMAIFSMIYMPAAVSHKISSKIIKIKSSLIVGSSPEFNCSDVLTNDDPNIELTAAHRSSRHPSGGRSGICWPTFASAHNLAPRKPHAGIMSYNAITGLLDVSGSTFVGFKNVCSGESNVIFITNPLNEDLQHPIHVEKIQLVDSTEQSKIFIHRPDISKVNPSDCVDMVCDAKRKSFLRDMDGSFLGNSGSVIPQAEYEWNGNSQLGIGDYRIPKVMLTFLNGSRIPVTEKAPYKGIIRDSTCKYIPEWQSYQCFGMEYAMMVIESLDSDTETRRLSPVAIVSNGYVDLINGPQDHGWCAGYTCQRRLSLFHSIVALNQSYEVYFTGTSPQNLRLMLLNVDQNKAVLVGIFFSTLQRLDVYVNNSLVCPKHTVWDTQKKHCKLNRHLHTGQFLPNLDSTILGENYFDRTYQMLYILVKGTVPIEIHTATVIFVSFQLPAVTEDDFYSSQNLVRNLALFLKIPSDKIRVTRIIGGESLRRKRSMRHTIEVEIGEPPIQFLPNGTTGQMQLSELQEIAASLGQAVILGKISNILGFNVSSMYITTPIPRPSDSGWTKVTAQPVERSAFPVHHVAFVSSLSVITQPVAAHPGQPFSQQPSVKAVDSNGNCVSVGISSLTLKVILKDANNNQVSGLSGNTTIPFSSCWANYTDLTPLRTGKNYKIEFILDNTIRVESRPFSLTAQSVFGGGSSSSSSGGGSSGGGSSSSSSHSKASTVHPSAHLLAIVMSCLIGKILLLELYMATVFILNIIVGGN